MLVALAAPRVGVTRVGLFDSTTEPVPVAVVTPVPPLETLRTPSRVTAPVVGEDGVRPVVPALNEVTAVDESVAQVGANPVLPTST